MPKILRVGTRGSRLALTQTNLYIEGLKQKNPDLNFDIKVIKTSGDKFGHLAPEKVLEVSGKGIFTKEIEEELLKGSVDFAIHSLKDLPNAIAEGLEISGFSKRQYPQDALVAEQDFKDLPDGALLGTSSLRRQFQIARLARVFGKSVRFAPLRGNVETRIKKVKSGEFAGVVLSLAGLKRLGLDSHVSAIFDPHNEVVPACGQGILAVEIRRDREDLKEILSSVEDRLSRKAALIERKILSLLGGGCLEALGIYAEIQENKARLSLYRKKDEAPEKMETLEFALSQFEDKIVPLVKKRYLG